jgi:iron-sulfur cluster repair protein YtfE (RIC family)
MTIPSFLSLLEVHRRLDELFLAHQEALLDSNIERAAAILDEFESELRSHMRFEEELLFPIYERAGRIEGGPIEFYSGEHKKLLDFLARSSATLAGMRAAPPAKRQIVELFDQEAMFKQLLQHHDARERNILYPTLDKVATEAERVRLLQQG